MKARSHITVASVRCNWPRFRTRQFDPKHAFEMGRMNGRKRRESGRRHYPQDAPIAVVGVGRRERLPIARFHCGPSGRSCAPGGADRANCRAANCRRRRQRRRAGPAVIRRSSGAIGVTLSAYPTNSVFTACLIFVLDKIQCLDHAPESSLELDNCSRTTIRHNNKPRPWCRRTWERYRRNRHNRSCSCPLLSRWPPESGHAS
jgi:hypothetical protein